MSWISSHSLPLTLLIVYLVVLAHHAHVGRRHAHSVDGYLVAGRSLGGFVIAMSFFATFMSTNTFIGAAGQSWNYGLTWCLGGVVLTALACISWFVVAPRFVPLTREYSSLTVADFLGTHYQSPRVRRLAGFIVGFSSVLYLVAIYRGASLAIESFLDLPYAWCVIIVCVVVTAYTLVGGFKSVVLTDAVQGVLMLVGAVALFAALSSTGGGPDQILARLHDIKPSLTSFGDREALAATMAYSLAVGVKYLVEPRQLSRFYGLKDDTALRNASWIAPAAILVAYLCLLPLGAMARTVLSDGTIDDTDQLVPYLLGPGNIFGELGGSLFLLVLLSAAMSSIDSVLLVAASTIDRDAIRLAEAYSVGDDTRIEVYRTRIWIVAISVISAVTALSPVTQDIVRMTKFSGSLYGACFLPTLVLGLFAKNRNATAAIATLVSGAVTVIGVFVLRQLGYTSLQEVYPGILVGVTVFLCMNRRNSHIPVETPSQDSTD